MNTDIDCVHNETINTDFIGTCKLCGQQLQYYDDLMKKPHVLQRGSINGVPTRVKPLTANHMPPKRPAPAAEVEEVAPLLETIERLPAPLEAGHKPANWDEMNRSQKHMWLENHRDAIIQDTLTIGVDATLIAWDIPVGTYQRLKARWPELPEAVPTSETGRTVSAARRQGKRGSATARRQYFNKHKEEIIADYYTMPLVLFFKKWGMSTGTWRELKKLWGVKGKRRKRQPPEVPASAKEVAVPEPIKEERGEAPPWHPVPITQRAGARGAWSF